MRFQSQTLFFRQDSAASSASSSASSCTSSPWNRSWYKWIALTIILLFSPVHSFSFQYCSQTKLPHHTATTLSIPTSTNLPRTFSHFHRQPLLSLAQSSPPPQQQLHQYSSTATTPSLGYDESYTMANNIKPHTKPLHKSMAFYWNFVANYFATLQQQRKSSAEAPRIRGKRRAMWRKLNEQRKNIISLAGYTSQLIVPSFTFLFLGAWMTSIVPAYSSKCIQCVANLSTTTRGQLLEAVIGLTVSSTLAALFTGLRGSLFWIGGCRCNYNVRVKLHRSLLLQEAAFFDMNETGYLLSRLNSDVNKIGQVISYHVNVVMRQFAQFVFGSIYLMRISPMLSMWAFAGIGLVAWLSAVYGDFSRELAEQVQDTFAEGTSVAETSFSMSKTVRAFNGAEMESQKYEAGQSKALELEEVQAWAYGTHKFLSDTLQAMLQGGLLLACWSVGKAGGLPSSQLTTFMFYTSFVLESSNEVGDEWAKIQQAVGASSSVFDLIRRIPAIRDPANKKARTQMTLPKTTTTTSASLPQTTTNGHIARTENEETKKPIITMNDVSLRYQSMERPALSGVNVKIYPGERVALVGSSGGGKSSMLKCLMRFYDPSEGSIVVCDEDLRTMTRAETAQKIAIVPQEPQVFPTSVIENVLYGISKDEVDPQTGNPVYSEAYRKAVAESLTLAGLSVEPGNDLGLTLDTRIGEGGRALSGGQRQRVAIARALIRNPEVLLLDEPTAALDAENERKVLESLKNAMSKTRSMVMVTHRLGVIRALDVNRVIVMEHGRIVEDGNPEELIERDDSPYAALAREQGILAKSEDAAIATERSRH